MLPCFIQQSGSPERGNLATIPPDFREILVPPTTLEVGQQIRRGVSHICTAIALQIINGDMPPIDHRIVTIMEALEYPLRRYLSTSKIIGSTKRSGLYQSFEGRTLAYAPQQMIYSILWSEFQTRMNEVRSYKERMKDVNVVTITGHQGSGKDALRPLFERYGYKPLGGSDIVCDVATALGLDRNDTQIKIDVGWWMKLLLDNGVITDLAIVECLRQGKNNLANFGPRVKQEAKGLIIALITDINPEIDRQIRFTRVRNRAMEEPARIQDVNSFDTRESQEYPIIAGIISKAKLLLVNNYPDKTTFLNAAEQQLLHAGVFMTATNY